MRKYLVEVPEEVAKRLEQSGATSMHIDNQLLVIRPDDSTALIPQLRFRSFGALAVLFALAFLTFFKWATKAPSVLPWAGEYSISSSIALLSMVSGIISFAVAFIRQKVAKQGPARDFTWRSLLPLVVACAMIIAIIALGLGWLIDQLFPGLGLDQYTASVLIFVSLSIVNYLLINLAYTLSPGVVINLMTIMIIGGVGVAMLTNSSKDWWRYNFSFLGTHSSESAWQFNITLIFAGMLMATLVDYLFVNLAKQYQNWKLALLRWFLWVLAANIAGIGLFPNDPKYHWLHDQIAMWLVYLLWILIVIVRWCLPKVTSQFLKVSYVIGGVIVLDYFMFKVVRYLSLTAFELFAFALAFAWILLLFQYIESLLPSGKEIVPVKLVPIKKQDQ